jgi:hypothetical protein
VRCEKSAEDGSPKSGRGDDFEEACALLIVKPETVVRWHRAGFHLEVPDPRPGSGDVLVNVRFAAINPAKPTLVCTFSRLRIIREEKSPRRPDTAGP